MINNTGYNLQIQNTWLQKSMEKLVTYRAPGVGQMDEVTDEHGEPPIITNTKIHKFSECDLEQFPVALVMVNDH